MKFTLLRNSYDMFIEIKVLIGFLIYFIEIGRIPYVD
jgi:hypothetical protein